MAAGAVLKFEGRDLRTVQAYKCNSVQLLNYSKLSELESPRTSSITAKVP